MRLFPDVPHTIKVVGDRATLLVSFVPGGLERFLVPRDGEKPDYAAFGLALPYGRGPERAAFVTLRPAAGRSRVPDD